MIYILFLRGFKFLNPLFFYIEKSYYIKNKKLNMNKNIKKYDEYIFEYKSNDLKMEDFEIQQMDQICDLGHGIKDVIIWIGNNKLYNDYIVKVSNIPNDLTGKNCFTLSLSDNKIIGEINKEFINDFVLDKIIKFLNKNKSIIKKYSDTYNIEFLEKLKK
jgi:hypothetical protein